VSAPSSSDSSSSDDEAASSDIKALTAQGDLPQDFWQVRLTSQPAISAIARAFFSFQIQKLIRYLKIGNQTATVISLCVLYDFDLSREHCQLAILDAGGLEVLANLLETEDGRCRTGALRILSSITSHPLIRKRTTQMGGIELLIRILSDKNKEMQLMAAETMANLAKFRAARTIVRRNGGIPRLVDLLDVDLSKVSSIRVKCDNVILSFSGATKN